MLDQGPGSDAVIDYTTRIRAIMHALMVTGKGTRDLCGAAGLTTEEFVDEVRTNKGATFPTLDRPVRRCETRGGLKTYAVPTRGA